jgi:hypothetical protein
LKGLENRLPVKKLWVYENWHSPPQNYGTL